MLMVSLTLLTVLLYKPPQLFLSGPYKRLGFNPEDEGLAGLQWDSAKLFQVNGHFIIFCVSLITGIKILLHYFLFVCVFVYCVYVVQLTTIPVKGDYDAFTLQEVIHSIFMHEGRYHNYTYCI